MWTESGAHSYIIARLRFLPHYVHICSARSYSNLDHDQNLILLTSDVICMFSWSSTSNVNFRWKRNIFWRLSCQNSPPLAQTVHAHYRRPWRSIRLRQFANAANTISSWVKANTQSFRILGNWIKKIISSDLLHAVPAEC